MLEKRNAADEIMKLLGKPGELKWQALPTVKDLLLMIRFAKGTVHTAGHFDLSGKPEQLKGEIHRNAAELFMANYGHLLAPLDRQHFMVILAKIVDQNLSQFVRIRDDMREDQEFETKLSILNTAIMTTVYMFEDWKQFERTGSCEHCERTTPHDHL